MLVALLKARGTVGFVESIELKKFFFSCQENDLACILRTCSETRSLRELRLKLRQILPAPTNARRHDTSLRNDDLPEPLSSAASTGSQDHYQTVLEDLFNQHSAADEREEKKPFFVVEEVDSCDESTPDLHSSITIDFPLSPITMRFKESSNDLLMQSFSLSSFIA